MQDREILIEEYRSLRSEIMKRQDSRLLLVGFSVTAIAALLGIVLKDNSPVSTTFYTPLPLFVGVFLIIIIALLLTLQQTQQIDILFKNLKISEILASYLGKFTDDLSDKEVNARKYLTFYYFVLSLLMVLIAWYMSIFTNIFNSSWIITLFVVIVVLSIFNINKGIHGTDFYIEYLIDFLANDEDENIRCRSARALGNIENEKTIQPLLESFFDPKPIVRKESEQALIKKESSGIEIIITYLDENFEKLDFMKYLPNSIVPIDEVMGRLIFVLGEIGDERAIDPLIKVYPFRSDLVVKALSKIKSNNEKLFPLFIKALNDENSDTKMNAASILGTMGNKDAINPLIDILNDNHPEVRSNAMKSLVFLGKNDSKVFNELIKQLDEKDPYFVMASADALQLLGNKKAIPYLENVLERFKDEKININIERIQNAINQIESVK